MNLRRYGDLLTSFIVSKNAEETLNIIDFGSSIQYIGAVTITNEADILSN